MIPYITIPDIPIYHELKIHIFGLLVSLGVFSGCLVAYKDAQKYDLNVNFVIQIAYFGITAGFIVSYWFVLLFYFPERLVKNPLSFFKLSNVFNSMSSMGGFFGATVALFIFAKIKKISFLKYIDNASLGVLVGQTFGRLGCALAHDHPGQFSNFPLAVRFPEGARHDLGLYEFFFQVILMITLLCIRKKEHPPGFIFALYLILYTPIRFLLDFLRTNDRTYFGLTPGQYCSMIGLLCGLYIMRFVYANNKTKKIINQKKELFV